jgi:hypothetical protein
MFEQGIREGIRQAAGAPVKVMSGHRGQKCEGWNVQMPERGWKQA